MPNLPRLSAAGELQGMLHGLPLLQFLSAVDAHCLPLLQYLSAIDAHCLPSLQFLTAIDAHCKNHICCSSVVWSQRHPLSC